MGAIHFSLDVELVKALRKTLSLEYFVETGTFHGDTTAAMAPLFAKVHTIELSREIFDETSKRLAPLPNVTMALGASPETLERLKPQLAEASVLYWLDAHWCGGVTGGVTAECPLLDEFKAIGALNQRSVVLIDDARFFITPPPEPHKVADWPMLDQVIDGLKALSSSHRVWIINDVFIFAPQAAEANIVEYGRRRGVDLVRLNNVAARAAAAISERDAAVQALKTAAAAPPTTPTPPKPQSALGPPGAPARFNAAFTNDARSEQIFAFHLARLGVRRVLDIGSNSGQFAQKLRRLGYDGTIYSVEPQAAPYHELLANAAEDNRWLPLPRQGAGREAGYVELHVSANSWSSSILEVHANHLAAEPATRTVAAERIYVGKAGDLLRDEAMAGIDALKIDVQGFEQMVLDGYGERLAGVRLLMLEMSLVECYQGAPDMFGLDKRLVDEFGFARISLEPAYYDDLKGVVQQYDGIYHRPQAAPSHLQVDGLAVSAVVTSIGGPIHRLRSDGADVGAVWRTDCAASWTALTPKVISVSEAQPGVPGVEWAQTLSKPSIAELFRRAEAANGDGHTVLVNADIRLTDELAKSLPALEPDAVYCARRHEVRFDLERPTGFTVRGAYDRGFDLFLLPAAFIRAVNAEQLLSDAFLIGEPWWDYLVPVLAFELGFPCKKLSANNLFALHYSHDERFSREQWRANGLRFLGAVKALQERPCCYAPALLAEILEPRTPLDKHLDGIAEAICLNLP